MTILATPLTWYGVAGIAAAIKVAVTVFGIWLKRSGDIWETAAGRWCYILSKITPPILAGAMFQAAKLNHDAPSQTFFGWLTVASIVLVSVVVARRIHALR